MNMQEIGYFLFMEEQEKEQRDEVNVELKTLLVRETPTQKQNEGLKIFFSRNIPSPILLLGENG